MKRQIDRFTLVEPLGTGGGGTVYRAEEQLATGVRRSVALKLLSPIAPNDAKGTARFIQEVKVLAALGGHPNVPAVLATGIADGTPWIATEFLPETLTNRISDQPASADLVARMIRHVGRALEAMHALELPLVHNDVKPDNILIAPGAHFKLADFGQAGAADQERTRVVATVRYSAPEVLSRDLGRVSPSSDLYALGHVAYEMALGGKLYRQQFPSVYDDHQGASDAHPARWMAWHCSMGTVPAPVHEARPDFPTRLGQIIARLMSKPAATRYRSASDLLDDLGSTPVLDNSIPAKPAPAVLAAPPVGARAVASVVRTVPENRPTPTTGSERYYVKLRGRVTGPFDLASLQRQARQGLISRLHQVATDQVNWRSASTVDGLFAGVS